MIVCQLMQSQHSKAYYVTIPSSLFGLGGWCSNRSVNYLPNIFIFHWRISLCSSLVVSNNSEVTSWTYTFFVYCWVRWTMSGAQYLPPLWSQRALHHSNYEMSVTRKGFIRYYFSPRVDFCTSVAWNTVYRHTCNTLTIQYFAFYLVTVLTNEVFVRFIH